MLRKVPVFVAAAAISLAAMKTACAADAALGGNAPPPLAPNFAWTGFYAGGNVGYGSGHDPVTMATVSGAGFPFIGAGTQLYGPPRHFVISPEGWNGGVQIGYNNEIAPNWVVGIEADIQASDMSETKPCVMACWTPFVTAPSPGFLSLFPVVFSEHSAEHKIDWFGTLRGRIGRVSGRALYYVTGGFAYAEVNRSARVIGSTVGAISGTVYNSFAGSFSSSSIQTGWTVGGGAEAQLFGQWSGKVEYLYMDLGSVTDSFNTIYTSCPAFCTVGTVAATRTDTADIVQHIFRVGLNRKIVAQ